MNREFKNCEIFGAKAKKYKIGAGEIYWLQRGECYLINGKRVLTIGGAASTDKESRTEGVDWWPEELLSYTDEQKVLDTCQNYDWKFDIVLSHTAPTFVVKELVDTFLFTKSRVKDQTAQFLGHLVEQNIEFSKWYFGHFHVNWDYYGQYICHYKGKPIKVF